MLGRLRTRDPEAWDRLVTLFGPVLYRWCRQAGLQPSDAADSVQEVFRSVAENLEAFHRSSPGETFRGWLWTITRNKVRDHFRRQASFPQACGGTDAGERIEQLPEGDLSDSEEQSLQEPYRLVAQRALELVRSDFDEKTWQVFWRMTVEGHSSAEIAHDLGMTSNAVRQAKYRVLRRLREELDGLL
jgi:RNA polymerase sigma-70 factor (ECF subfamily)